MRHTHTLCWKIHMDRNEKNNMYISQFICAGVVSKLNESHDTSLSKSRWALQMKTHGKHMCSAICARDLFIGVLSRPEL